MEIEDALYEFVRDEAVPATGWTVEEVFRILGELVLEFEPKNRELLDKREDGTAFALSHTRFPVINSKHRNSP